MPYKIRSFSISFYYVDDGKKDFQQAIIDFVNSIKYPERFRPSHLGIEIERGLPDARTPEEIEKDRAEEEEAELYDEDEDEDDA